MFYFSSSLKKPNFYIFWFFFIAFLLNTFLLQEKTNFYFLVLILAQIFILYLMFYLYQNLIQNFIKNSILPINIEFKKINLSNSFKKPFFDKLPGNLLMFSIFYHPDYDKEDYKYKDLLKEDINFKVSTLWKHTILHFNKFETYVIKILVYCFLFGIILLFISYQSYLLIDNDLYKKTYIFFTFLSFSFWLYITILILRSESLIKNYEENRWKYEIYNIYNNLNITSVEIEKLSLKVDEINKHIQTYITVSSTVLYIGFLTIIGAIF